MTQPTRRAVVTGIGVVAPTGIGAEEHWRSVLAGELARPPDRGLRPDRVRDHARRAGRRLRRRGPRRRAAGGADRPVDLDVAGRDPAGARRRRVRPGRARPLRDLGGPGGRLGRQRVRPARDPGLCSKGPKAVGAYQSIAWFYAASTGQFSIRHGTKGPAACWSPRAPAGWTALGHARRVMRRGTPAVLAGGTEAPLSPVRAGLPGASGRLTAAATRGTATSPSTSAPTATPPARAARCCCSRTLEAARRAGRAADLRRDRRLRRHARRLPPEDPAPDAAPVRPGHAQRARRRRGDRRTRST